MSDAPVTAAPAPSAPAASPAAPEAQKTHHAAAQPRTPQGQFNGPPDPTKAPSAAPTGETPPPSWKVGGREFKDPSELASFASEADSERRALDAYRQRAAEAAAKQKEYEERLKDPSKLITAEMKRAILEAEVKAFQEQEWLKTQSPEQQRLYLYAKEREEKAAALEAQLKQHESAAAETKRKAEEEAAQKAEATAREEMKATLSEAVALAGLDPNNPWDFQRVVFVVKGAAERGVVYSPEVIARKVKEGIQREQASRLKSAKPTELLSIPEVVAALNGIDDAATLRLLAPLGEKLRRLNLQSLGAAPVPAPAPVVTNATGTAMEKPAPGDATEWERYFRQRAKGGGNGTG